MRPSVRPVTNHSRHSGCDRSRRGAKRSSARLRNAASSPGAAADAVRTCRSMRKSTSSTQRARAVDRPRPASRRRIAGTRASRPRIRARMSSSRSDPSASQNDAPSKVRIAATCIGVSGASTAKLILSAALSRPAVRPPQAAWSCRPSKRPRAGGDRVEVPGPRQGPIGPDARAANRTEWRYVGHCVAVRRRWSVRACPGHSGGSAQRGRARRCRFVVGITAGRDAA